MAADGDAFEVINGLPLNVEQKNWLSNEDVYQRAPEPDEIGAAVDQGFAVEDFLAIDKYIGSLDARDENNESVQGLKKAKVKP